ncbi:hypothetical protein F5883DRAFT_590731 [Diaporthe sp. PMI_573]|nr:hypothetical protein F5883DRAFT_590731 [Diaporthaceae sp. PMI_573]
METIAQALESAPGFLENIFNNFRDKDNPELDEQARRRAMQPQSEAKDVLANIGRCLDQFDDLAQPLIGKYPNTQKHPRHEFRVEEFQRLSCESIATATLFQCFCKACPRHHRHTAYLSLESSNSAAPGTRMAILSSGPKEKDPIWLRVVSMAPQRPCRKTADDMEWTPEPGKHKRRRSSDGLAPPSKLPKTAAASPGAPEHDGHVGIDILPRNLIQFCPEYLAQHEEAELLVMQMVDASSAFHKFYFLPADERPPANCEPVSLHKMLLQDHRRIVPIGNTQILWKVQVARLIAEAALQFDWPETRCRWGREDIIFYMRQPPSDILGPFLKVEIESWSHTTNTTSGEQPPSGGGQTRRLLNLAFTLLQVGLFKPIEPPPESYNDRMYRDYIVHMLSTGEAQITGDYNTVVRQCTELAAAAAGADIDREDFRKRYYRDIISPLKGMESNLLGLQRKNSGFG